MNYTDHVRTKKVDKLLGISPKRRSLLMVLFIIILASCGSPALNAPASSPAFRPMVSLQVCLDNTGSYPSEYREAAQKAIADRIDAMMQANTGGMAVFVSQIAQNSFQNDLLDFSVPAIKALPTAPLAGADPYKYAQAMRDYKKALATAQNQLHTIQAQVKVFTDKLRNLRLTVGAAGTDIPGCLADASEHFSHVSGTKVLLIVSDTQSNVNTQYTDTLDLHGVTVRVLYRTCQAVRACQENDAQWTHTFKHFGAATVQFFDPAESEALHITF